MEQPPTIHATELDGTVDALMTLAVGAVRAIPVDRTHEPAMRAAITTALLAARALDAFAAGLDGLATVVVALGPQAPAEGPLFTIGEDAGLPWEALRPWLPAGAWPDAFVYVGLAAGAGDGSEALLTIPGFAGRRTDPSGRALLVFDAATLAEHVTVVGRLAPPPPEPAWEPWIILPPAPDPPPPRVVRFALLGLEPAELAPVNAWLGARGHPPGLYAADRRIALGAFPGLDPAAFLAFLRGLPWEEDAPIVELLSLGPDDEAYRRDWCGLLGYDGPTVAEVGGMATFASTCGPFQDPLLALLGSEPPPALGAVRAWLASHAPGAELRPEPGYDRRAWGLWDDKRPWRAWAVTGTYDHEWAIAFLAFLDTLDVPGGGLHTGSTTAWRTWTWIGGLGGWPQAPETLQDWHLERLRELAYVALPPAEHLAPPETDLARFDAACATYLRARGYEVVDP